MVQIRKLFYLVRQNHRIRTGSEQWNATGNWHVGNVKLGGRTKAWATYTSNLFFLVIDFFSLQTRLR